MKRGSRCTKCIWQNNAGKCEWTVLSVGLDDAPYFRENNIEPKFSSIGQDGNDCIGFEHIPETEAVTS